MANKTIQRRLTPEQSNLIDLIDKIQQKAEAKKKRKSSPAQKAWQKKFAENVKKGLYKK